MTNTEDTAAPPPKPGYKTTEFWLKIAAFALTALFASGVIPTSGPVAQVAAITATMLGALGYTVSRTLVKNATVIMMLIIIGMSLSTVSCGATSKSAGKAVLADVVDCTTADRLKLEEQFGPVVEQALQRATGIDGKIDLPSLQQIAGPLKADGWCVLERQAAKLIAWVAGKVGTASAAQPLDARDLAAQVARLRGQKFGTTQFQLGGP
jgi:hypothetical protein